MSTNMLDENQLPTFVKYSQGYGYGLGVRCPRDNTKTDFGWSGAAGSFLAIDRTNNITVFYAQHITSPPNVPVRDKIIDYVLEDLKSEA